ncbi:MAG: hypoxanthine phosphoribosyltransferase [Lachnospirales bacterium]
MSKFEVLIHRDALIKRIKELAEEINNDFSDEITLICVLKGGVMFFTELSKYLKMDVKFDFICLSSYEDSQITSGIVKITKDLDFPINGKNVVVVEDIIDTGHSLERLKRHLEEQGPKTLKFCTLLDKFERRETNYTNPDYNGFRIEDKFVVGFGLDDKQLYRNLDYIGVVNGGENE